MQTTLLLRIVSKLFKIKLEPIYKQVQFLDLDMEDVNIFDGGDLEFCFGNPLN